MDGIAVVFEPVHWRITPYGKEFLHDAVLPNLSKSLRRRIQLLMAGSKGDWLETQVKNEVLGAVAFAAPTPVFFGLWGTAGSINDASHGGTAGEVSGGSYARVSMTNNTTNFPTVGDNVAKVNNVAITFPTASANWNGGANINQVMCLDGNAGTSADHNMLWADLTVPKPVLNGDTAQFAVSGFSWTED